MAQKTNEIFTKDHHDFISIHFPKKATFYMNNAFIPFGLNDNNTLKCEFAKTDNDLYRKIEKKEKDFFAQSIELLQTMTNDTGNTIQNPICNSRLQKKGSYPPTLLCSIKYRQHNIQTEILQHSRGLCTIYTLKRKRVHVRIECDTVWFNKKTNRMNCHWKINTIEII